MQRVESEMMMICDEFDSVMQHVSVELIDPSIPSRFVAGRMTAERNGWESGRKRDQLLLSAENNHSPHILDK